jgi:hypothetical protein
MNDGQTSSYRTPMTQRHDKVDISVNKQIGLRNCSQPILAMDVVFSSIVVTAEAVSVPQTAVILEPIHFVISSCLVPSSPAYKHSS